MQTKVIFIGIFALLLIAYTPSFNASWHLDDEPNILNNAKLHLTGLESEQIKNAITADPTRAFESTKLYRPVPCLSLALNWYIGQDNVFGYHVVNFMIHLLCSWILFLTLRLILTFHFNKSNSQVFINSVAFLATTLWALAPIQTQAVTYIIQRMAAMAALFTILAIYSYLRCRTGRDRERYKWLILCILSFFAALGSKENSILIPASIILIELAFFQHKITKLPIGSICLCSILSLISGLLFVRFGLDLHFFNILDGYNHRSFTFSERILTEPRIVMMYLSQILFPLAERLSIDHDIILSTSFFAPPTTLPSILCLFSLITLSICYLKKYPLYAFPVLFFFLNHIVESTVIPLELVFEHRNYIPSFFLFLPIALLITQALYGKKKFSHSGRFAVVICSAFFLIISGHATYTRNLAWANEGTLWMDTIQKAPQSPRAAHNLGRWHRQFGRYNQAYYYFRLALINADKAATPNITKNAALNGLASVSYILGQHEESLDLFNQCLEIDQKDEACLKNRALANLQLARYNNAAEDAMYLSDSYPSQAEYKYIAALSSYYSGNLIIAQKFIDMIVPHSYENHQTMYLTGLILLEEGPTPNSIFFLKRALKLAPENINYIITLAATYLSNNNQMAVDKLINDLIEYQSLPDIQKVLQKENHYGIGDDIFKSLKRQIFNRINQQLSY